MENQLRSASENHAISSLSSSAVNSGDHYYSTENNNSKNLASSSNSTAITASAVVAKTHSMPSNDRRVEHCHKLLIDGDVQVCRIRRARNSIEKLQLFHRWENHHINLDQNGITTTTNEKYMDKLIAYSVIEDISVYSKTKVINWHHRFCIRIDTNHYIYFFRVNKLDFRDQLFYSIRWKLNKVKFEHSLRSANNLEVLLKEITNMIDFTMTIPIEDVEVHQFPLEIISDILQQQEFDSSRFVHENVIEALAPLLEKNYPSPEICDFFSLHCRNSPRSHIVIEMFTPAVEKILKHNTDFSKRPRLRILVQEYILALNSQPDGLGIVEDFIKRMHGPTMVCPFLRVLSNLISVCLAGINNFFEDRKKFRLEDEAIYRAHEEKSESQLVCYTTILKIISTFYDWRRHFGLVLQPVPFQYEALRYERFMEIFKNVVKNLVEDTRCEVHRTVLGIREGKNGWFEMFCLGGILCDDDGKMFSLMLNRLILCCCRRKRFLLSINKLLPSLMLLALNENQSSLDTLCAMLDLDAVENNDNKLQLISTLKSTPSGLKMYAKVCERQRALQALQQKGGPRELTLPSRSTDDDLARLLSTGPFGNLESLSLAFTNVTSACAEHLIKLPALKNLNLWSTRFGDVGLELISEHLNQLEELNLCETPVTDKGLTYLAYMTMLRKLNLNSTHLSLLAIKALKEKLPALEECDIRYTEAW
ncbi:unnamed protein product [Rotaria sp. Silwood1]|nr:unnamed protein product [Rotaria sp. Silwood1]CAF4753793.1 unnamed protein product [Rotaria sp. Silwood1]CAF4871140.1 unnamed protein product [Rotaria sp. Silwood1]